MRYTLKQQFLDELRYRHGSIGRFTFTEACKLYIDIQRRRGSKSTTTWNILDCDGDIVRPRTYSQTTLGGPRAVSMNVYRILCDYAMHERVGTYKNDNPRYGYVMLSLGERIERHCTPRSKRYCRGGTVSHAPCCGWEQEHHADDGSIRRRCNVCTFLD